MSEHTGLYKVLTKREVSGHRKGEVFEHTAEKAVIGILVTAGLIAPVHETGEAGTEEGDK